MKKMFLYICSLALPFFGLGQSVQKLFNQKVVIALPAELKPLGDPKDNNVYVFADEKRSVKFNITLSDEVVEDNDITAYADDAINDIKKQSGWKIFDDGVSLNAGKNIAYIKYRTGNIDPGLFEYVFYGSLDTKLLTFYFSCKEEARSNWEKKIDKIVASLRINDISPN